MQPGNRIGAYALVEELGAGGMGVVWRAHDSRLGRDVALKILPPHLAEHPTALVRFEREARGLASLSHPGIVSIFDLGEEGDLRYLVTELLSGQTLRDALRPGAMPWRRAAEIGATIAEGLAAAHAKGIIHRDLKPENVFITAEGRVKILDFGLAKELAISGGDETTQAHHTEPGAVMGTLEKANELDPLSLAIYLDQAWIHYTRNEIQVAIDTVRKAVRHDPRSPLARYELAWDLDHDRQYAEAIDTYESALRLEKKDTAAMTLLRNALRDGETDYLRQHLALAEAAGEPHTTLAAILLQLGDTEAAMDQLELAYEKHERDVIYLKTSPTYAALRTDARFQLLIQKIGFPE